MTLVPYIAELRHKDLLSVVCRRKVMVYEGVDDWTPSMSLSNTANFCDQVFPVLLPVHPGL